ncbi:MAG: tripartite tricarboxylate transporter substrate binding protein [Burkholderiales bacterium]|mgnify:CR=1 FL=1|nr:tripartite tricarboxylate transporter substrate binding protein [Burkholderiales bacterium]
MKQRTFAVIAALFSSITCSAQPSSAAEDFPSRPVRFIVPYPAGGGVDILIRAIGQELSIRWKQPVVVENRGGAAGIIGTQAVANAAPNGETLLATVDSPFTANRYLFKSLPYDPEKSFAPVAMLVRNYNFVLAHPSVAANSLREVVALAKSEPGKLNFGSYGQGSHPHLLFGLLAQREGVQMTHVPYKGVTPLLTAIVANEVPLTTGSAAVASAQIKAGRLKPIAYAGPKRSADFPDVPTTAEQGYGYLLSPIWYGVFAPAGTPPAIVEKINQDIRAVLTDADFVRRNVTPKGQEVAIGKPEDLAAAIRQDSTLVGEMAKAAGLKPE